MNAAGSLRGRLAICPGSFDPVTLGHLDIIRRAAKMFDQVIVAVLVNPGKNPSFTVEERMDMLRRSLNGVENVTVECFDGLLADYARQKGAQVIVRGLRAVTDFEYEFQMALANRKMNGNIDTVFLTTSAEYMYLSSSMVKSIACFGGDISDFVPTCICREISERLCLPAYRRQPDDVSK
ncbi:MAG: pantetheine-phosphate adenylyltransferase [Clostridia bacterium]|nr:pantetheine-phosphate adenylyltransferase [Clostridia bacterium]